MQNGSVIRAKRQRGPDVWEFRWREPGADGKRKHRRMILGSTEQLADETTARQAIATLRLDLNHGEAWLKTRSTQFRSGVRRAASFVSSRRLQQLLAETGLLGGVPNLCLLEMARSVRKYCRFNEKHSH